MTATDASASLASNSCVLWCSKRTVSADVTHPLCKQTKLIKTTRPLASSREAAQKINMKSSIEIVQGRLSNIMIKGNSPTRQAIVKCHFDGLSLPDNRSLLEPSWCSLHLNQAILNHANTGACQDQALYTVDEFKSLFLKNKFFDCQILPEDY